MYLVVKRQTVILHWIKGHAEHDGNEIADRLAKAGAEMEPTELDTQTEITKSHFKGVVQEGLVQQWDREWKESTTCRQSKLFMPGTDPNIAKILLKLDRRNLGLAIQALTGHCFLRYHQHNCKKADSPLCRLCGEEVEESWHILTNCPALAKARQDTVYWASTSQNPRPD